MEAARFGEDTKKIVQHSYVKRIEWNGSEKLAK